MGIKVQSVHLKKVQAKGKESGVVIVKGITTQIFPVGTKIEVNTQNLQM